MTYPRLLIASVLAGLVAGLVIFAILHAFQASFVAAEELDFSRARGGAQLLVVIPGLVMGWLLYVAALRVTDYAGSALVLPLVAVVAAAIALSVGLVQANLAEVQAPLAGLAVMAGLAMFATASVLGWLNK